VGRLTKVRSVFRSLPLFVLVIAGAANDWMAASAQDHAELLPRLGETTGEFEARARGLARPGPGEPLSVILHPDTQGHFYVEPTVNGAHLRMMVDTGATLVILSREDARWAGINPTQEEYTMPATTANGVVLLAPVVLDEVVVGEVAARNVPGAVLPDNTLQVGLLGMSFLSKLSQFEVAGRQLVFKQ
jgi:aspartyl protease family protein